jgi:hypothetical protein
MKHVVLAVVGVAVACASCRHTPKESDIDTTAVAEVPEADDIREGIVRQLVAKHTRPGASTPSFVIFVHAGSSDEASRAFVKRFAGENPVRVAPYSDSQQLDDGTLIDKKTLAPGVSLFVDQIRTISDEEARANASVYASTRAGEDGVYYLRKRHGEITYPHRSERPKPRIRATVTGTSICSPLSAVRPHRSA